MIDQDAVFRSPAVHTPQEGRDVVTLYLTGAVNVLGEHLVYVDEWVREHDAILELRTRIGDVEISAIDRITWDDAGRIVDFTVPIRPLQALTTVSEKMGQDRHGPPGAGAAEWQPKPAEARGVGRRVGRRRC